MPRVCPQPCEQAAPADTLLTCKGKGGLGTGYESSLSCVTKASETAVTESLPSIRHHVRGSYDLRQELIGNVVLATAGGAKPFSQDWMFTSPSTGAAAVLVLSATGHIEWKDARDLTLKALQEREAGA